jgi:diguanylate cyclase (GGDEF)-like protein
MTNPSTDRERTDDASPTADDLRPVLAGIGDGLLAATGATGVASLLDVSGTAVVVSIAVALPHPPPEPGADAGWFTAWLAGPSPGGEARVVHVEELTSGDGSRLGLLGLAWAPEDARSAADLTTVHRFAEVAGLAVEQVLQRRAAEAELGQVRGQAMTDPLTGLGSRALMLERLRHASTARPTGGQEGMAVVFVDLDRFKDVNDLHDHAVGDEALCTLARRLESVVRAHDTVARWGGDEFVILLHPLADESAGVAVAQRILEATAQPVQVQDAEVVVGASVGIAFHDPGTPVDGELLVQRADRAMFEVKHRGGNDYAVYQPSDPRGARRARLRELLHEAVTDDRLVVHYQPVVDVLHEHVVGVEALVRLRDDDGSLVLPAELLDRGELPVAVGQRLMRQACADVRRWVDAGHDLWLSLNVSPAQMADIDRFSADVLGALHSSGLAPDRLTLELTEHSLLSTTPRMLRGVEDLVSRGVGFSIDDFGTGYGSLVYVRDLPLAELKIDQSFVHDGAGRPAADAVVRTLVALASRLGLRCVAEGVENPDDLAFVRSAGVPYAQGLHWADALDPDAITALLARTQQDRLSWGTLPATR